jgi:dipeptidyl-peptidase-3
MVEANDKKFDPKEFIPTSCPIHQVACSDAWSQLSEEEKAYAFHMSAASWEGSKVCWFQCSYESPALFVLMHLAFQGGEGLAALKKSSSEAGVSEEEWSQFLVYCSAVYQNTGNFKSFGDTKFIPQLAPEQFTAILKSSAAYQGEHTAVIDRILDVCFKEIYSEEEPYARVGFRNDGGQTSYYSGNVNSEDNVMIDAFL